MKRTIHTLIAVGACLLAPASGSFASAARAQSVDWQQVDEALGRKPVKRRAAMTPCRIFIPAKTRA
jgi:hypothetical protein